MPSLETIPFDHRMQQHSIESHQRHIQMQILQMQHQELMQQHQQQQLLLQHQQHQAAPCRGNQEMEALHSPVEQCPAELRGGRPFHVSPPLRCPNMPFPRGNEAALQSTCTPIAASPQGTASSSSKRLGLSSELTVSPKDRQAVHGHSSFSFPFHEEMHPPSVDGQNVVGMLPDACSPSVIPLLSNMYHGQNRASQTAANMSNNPALFVNQKDVAFFMQDGAKKGPVKPVQDSVETATCEPCQSEESKLERKSPFSTLNKDSNSAQSANKASSMHNKKADPKLPMGNISLQEIFSQSLEGSAFPASSLLSAAAKAQLAKQSPDSPVHHHAGDLMSGMGLFNDNVPNSKLDSGSSQINTKRKQIAESLKQSDPAGLPEINSDDTSAMNKEISESPIQCLENAVHNLDDQPKTPRSGTSAAVVSMTVVPQIGSPERKRMNPKSIDDTLDNKAKKPRLPKNDSSHGHASEKVLSEAATSAHQVPETNTDIHFPMHQRDSTKVTGSYNVICSTGKATSSSEHPAVETSELARWQQQQQEWYTTMLRAKQQHGTGNIPLDHFPSEAHMRPPNIRSRGLQELQHIAMGGGPFPRLPAMQQHPNFAHMHQFPNRFVNQKFIPHQVNMMNHPQGIPPPFRMDLPVDPLDPKIPQNPSMCNSTILHSMLQQQQQQQQQQLQQLGMPPPGNFHHPINPMYHMDPSEPMKQFPDVANLVKAHQHGTTTHKAGTFSQRRKNSKVSRSPGGLSTGNIHIVDIDDEEPKDAAYWVKAASKLGGVKKVKDILAMTRSLKKHNSESGQVEAIFEAVLDSASGGMKVIIKEGTRAQPGSKDQGKGSNSDKPQTKVATETIKASDVQHNSNVSADSSYQLEQNKLESSELMVSGEDIISHTSPDAAEGHKRKTSKESMTAGCQVLDGSQSGMSGSNLPLKTKVFSIS